MKKILLCCTSGMSTSLLVDRLQDLTKDQTTLSLDTTSVHEVLDRLPGCHLLLLAPQLRFKLKELQSACAAMQVPVQVIDPVLYGSMNAKAVLASAMALLRYSPTT